MTGHHLYRHTVTVKLVTHSALPAMSGVRRHPRLVVRWCRQSYHQRQRQDLRTKAATMFFLTSWPDVLAGRIVPGGQPGLGDSVMA